MPRLVYASPDDGFWDTLVVLSLSGDSETQVGDELPAQDKEPAETSPEQRPALRRPRH